jgi:hypothetical protein
MEKTFKVAGVSTLNGAVTVRYANDLTRIKVLEKNGHTNVHLVDLPNEMTKEAAVAFLRIHPEFQDADMQAAFTATETTKAEKAEPKGKAPKEPKVKAPKVSVAALATATDETPAPAAPDGTEPVVAPAVNPAVAAIKAKNRETMRKTFAKLNAQQREERAAADALKKEEMQLEVDNYMKDVTADSVPAFMRNEI